MAVELHINVDEVLSGFEHMKLEGAVSKSQFKKIVTKELGVARRAIQSDARRVIKDDPRKAYKGVKAVTYKRRVLGGLVAILEPRGKTYTSNYQRPRSLKPGQVGGNRAKPHPDYTVRRQSYYGQSRAFVLRFLNSNTQQRTAGRFTANFKGANRGRIAKSEGWFEKSAERNAALAAERIGDAVSEAVTNEFNR